MTMISAATVPVTFLGDAISMECKPFYIFAYQTYEFIRFNKAGYEVVRNLHKHFKQWCFKDI